MTTPFERECVTVVGAIKARIERIQADVWEDGQANQDPLWEALDDIDAMILGARQFDGDPHA